MPTWMGDVTLEWAQRQETDGELRRTVGVGEIGHTCHSRGPCANSEQRHHHLRKDAPVHLKEQWPFRVLLGVTRSDLFVQYHISNLES